MQNEKMPKPKSMGSSAMLGVCSHLLLLAEIEAELKAKKTWPRSQQGRVAQGKKGRLRAILRYLRGVQADTIKYARSPIDFSGCGPLYRGPFHRAKQAGRPERKSESSDAVRQVSPKEEKG